MMKHFLAALLVCSLSLKAETVLANGSVVVKANVSTRSQAAQVPTCPAPAKHGLLQRLCHNSTAGAYAQRANSTQTATFLVADLRRPCNLPPKNGSGRPSLAGPFGHCFPACFLGPPCSCCHHHIKYLHPWSHEGRNIAAQIEAGMPTVTAYKVQDPGLLGPILRKKQFVYNP